MALLLCTCFVTAACADVVINEANFPDPKFRAKIANQFDINGDGVLQDSEINLEDGNARERISLKNGDFETSLKGIELIPCLRGLEIRTDFSLSHSLSYVDLSGCSNLVNVDIRQGVVISLNLRGLKKLRYVRCEPRVLFDEDEGEWTYEGLKTLDVRDCSALENLGCGSTQLTSLDLSGCTSLKKLSCGGNNDITTLDVSKLVNLEELYCANGTCYYIEGEKNFYFLTGRELTHKYFSHGAITELDTHNLTKLRILDCSGNSIISLDLRNSPLLEEVDCSGNELTYLNVDGLKNLESISFWENQITELDLGTNTALKEQMSGVSFINFYHNQFRKGTNKITMTKNSVQFDLNPYVSDLSRIAGSVRLAFCDDEEHKLYLEGSSVSDDGKFIWEDFVINDDYRKTTPDKFEGVFYSYKLLDTDNGDKFVWYYREMDVLIKMTSADIIVTSDLPSTTTTPGKTTTPETKTGKESSPTSSPKNTTGTESKSGTTTTPGGSESEAGTDENSGSSGGGGGGCEAGFGLLGLAILFGTLKMKSVR